MRITVRECKLCFPLTLCRVVRSGTLVHTKLRLEKEYFHCKAFVWGVLMLRMKQFKLLNVEHSIHVATQQTALAGELCRLLMWVRCITISGQYLPLHTSQSRCI